MIGFLTQLGYVAAYATSGIAADGLGEITRKGVGRGAAMVVFIAGICLVIVAIIVSVTKSIQNLDKG